MAKITVMVPVELEVTVSVHGELRVNAATWPTLDKCQNYMQVIPESLAESAPLGYFGEYAVIQR